MNRPPSEIELQQAKAREADKQRVKMEQAPLMQVLATPEGQALIAHLVMYFSTEGPCFTTSDTIQAAKQDGRREVVGHLIKISKPPKHDVPTTI